MAFPFRTNTHSSKNYTKEKKGLLPEEGLRALEGFVRQSG
jgi:hypothetical protein